MKGDRKVGKRVMSVWAKPQSTQLLHFYISINQEQILCEQQCCSLVCDHLSSSASLFTEQSIKLTTHSASVHLSHWFPPNQAASAHHMLLVLGANFLGVFLPFKQSSLYLYGIKISLQRLKTCLRLRITVSSRFLLHYCCLVMKLKTGRVCFRLK